MSEISRLISVGKEVSLVGLRTYAEVRLLVTVERPSRQASTM